MTICNIYVESVSSVNYYYNILLNVQGVFLPLINVLLHFRALQMTLFVSASQGIQDGHAKFQVDIHIFTVVACKIYFTYACISQCVTLVM